MCRGQITPAEGQSRVAEAKLLKERIEGSEKEAGLQGIAQFVEAVGQAAEPFVVPILPSILKCLADKVCCKIFHNIFSAGGRFWISGG